MDTEKMFLTDDGFNLVCEELAEEDLKTARHFIEITRHMQEIHQLFLIFKKDIDDLQSEYVLKNNGNVFREQNPANSGADYISVNSHIINIISAGRTLIESMECYIKNNSDIGDAKQKYLDYYHNTYDSSFAYRLLIRLRDYSQHGHLPVSSTGNNYYFDLIQISNKPHYNHNKTFETQMKSIIDEILEKYHNTPTISLTETLAEYVVKLLAIYKMFWYQTENELTEACAKFQTVVSGYPDNIIKGQEGLNGLFIYDVVDGNAHVVDPNDKPDEMVTRFKSEAEDNFEEYAEAYKGVLGANLYIKLTDGQIDVEPGLEFAEKAIECSETS
ncbi:MAG: hypothetical protein IJW86_04625 [Clostridia bacterium]|nr:hypothetical protein [Clostridia bacterium]